MSIQNNFPAIRPSLNLDFANTKELDPRITFTRASTASYYGTQTAKAEENLLLRSQDFTTTWSSGNSTKTANTEIAPDGTTTADTIIESGTSTFRRMDQNVGPTSGVVTISVFAKLGVGTRFLCIGASNDSTNTASATFDLSLGTGTQTQANGVYSAASATITAVAQSFYRCTLTVTTNSVSTVSVGFTDTSTPSTANRGFGANYTGDGTSSIILWGAQLEQRSSATAYTPTTTQTITNYIPVLETAASGVARFDHNPTTFESLGFLVEEQRTNLVTYSEQFDNAAWTKTNATITANTVVSPDGTLDADALIENTTNAVHDVSVSASLTSGLTYSTSVYFKPVGNRTLQLVIAGAAFTESRTWFNLSTLVATTTVGAVTSAKIENVGNGWYKASVSQVATSTASGSVFFRLWNGTTALYTGDGYSGIYIWGAQLEAGAFPTSYIPTVASQVTRAADAASMTGVNFSSWYNAGEGAFYTEVTPTVIEAGKSIIGSNINNYNPLFFGSSSTLDVDFRDVGGVLLNIKSSVTAISFKAAVTSSTTGSVSGSFNGELTSTSMPRLNFSTVNTLRIGNRNTGSTLNGTIRKITFYPKRLSNTELQGLTL